MARPSSSALSSGQLFTKETLIRGKPDRIECIEIGGQTFSINRGLVTIARLEDEWYEDLKDPQSVINALRASSGYKPDILTFWQRMPDIEPRYPYHLEWEDIAVLMIESYDSWWKNQIKPRVRNLIRKSEKEGLVVREARYDDDFVRGMTAIFNETSVRQGRRFWHYGKNFSTVKAQFSRFLFREHLIGAYFQDEMIGFMMLGDAGRYGLTGQVLSSVRHRDKAPNNALIAKAVEVCAARGLGALIYLFWSDDSLAEFKRRCGFERVRVPRYYVPLTATGALAIGCGAHRGWKAMLPKPITSALKRLRVGWHELRKG